jgi:hypothetical protein
MKKILAVALGLLGLVAASGCAMMGKGLPTLSPQEVADGAACLAQVQALTQTAQSQVSSCVALGADLKGKATTASK